MDGREGVRSTGRFTGRRVTMQQAADELGLTVEAIRKRVQRETLASDKGEDGRRYVYLDHGRDTYRAESRTAEGSPSYELVEALRDQIEYLQRQVEEEREARRRADVLLTRLMDRVPELEAPRQEPQEQRRGSPLRTEEGPEGSTPTQGPADPEAGVGRPEGTASRPWWRRLLGG